VLDRGGEVDRTEGCWCLINLGRGGAGRGRMEWRVKSPPCSILTLESPDPTPFCSSPATAAATATATASSSTTTTKKPATDGGEESLKKRPTRQTFKQFVELARPEAPAFLTALVAVAVVRRCMLVD
jgi:hypothetical protein